MCSFLETQSVFLTNYRFWLLHQVVEINYQFSFSPHLPDTFSLSCWDLVSMSDILALSASSASFSCWRPATSDSISASTSACSTSTWEEATSGDKTWCHQQSRHAVFRSHLSGGLLHLVVQLFDLLLQLFHIVQHLDPLLLYAPHLLVRELRLLCIERRGHSDAGLDDHLVTMYIDR